MMQMLKSLKSQSVDPTMYQDELLVADGQYRPLERFPWTVAVVMLAVSRRPQGKQPSFLRNSLTFPAVLGS